MPDMLALSFGQLTNAEPGVAVFVPPFAMGAGDEVGPLGKGLVWEPWVEV